MGARVQPVNMPYNAKAAAGEANASPSSTAPSEPNASPRSFTRRLTALFNTTPIDTVETWKSECVTAFWGFVHDPNGKEVRWANRIKWLKAYFDAYPQYVPSLQNVALSTNRTQEKDDDGEKKAVEVGLAEGEEDQVTGKQNADKPLLDQQVPDQVAPADPGSTTIKTISTEDNRHLLLYVKLLKINPDTKRKTLEAEIVDAYHGIISKALEKRSETSNTGKSAANEPKTKFPDGSGPEDFVCTSLTSEGNRKLFNTSLAAACRAIFGTKVYKYSEFRPEDRQGMQTPCIWTNDISLKEFLEKEFPVAASDGRLSGRFRQRLLSLRNLSRHADLTVVWTNHLPDHLLLSYEEQGKNLRLFNLPSLIEVSYEASKNVVNSKSDQKDSCHGKNTSGNEEFAYSAEFMLETLLTYHLLIPSRDSRWADRNLISKSTKSWLWWPLSGANKHNRTPDSRLTANFDFRYSQSTLNMRLTTYAEMFQRFPHWGLRLQSLMEEAEDPTPMSWTGRWAERRKGPRHAFWMTVVGFVVATIFAIVATALSVAQFWVGWCTWQQNGNPPLCNPLGFTSPVDNSTSTATAPASTTA